MSPRIPSTRSSAQADRAAVRRAGASGVVLLVIPPCGADLLAIALPNNAVSTETEAGPAAMGPAFFAFQPPVDR